MAVALPSKDQVVEFLQQEIPGPPPPSWFWRLLGAKPPEFSYWIAHLIGPLFGSLFQKQVVFAAMGGRDLLPWPCPPNGTFGYLAYDGATLWLLSPSTEAVEAVLRHEGRPLDGANAVTLADFICAIAFRPGSDGHTIIESAEEIEHFSWDGLDDYQVEPEEFEHCRPEIRAPRLAVEPTHGWRLEFTSVYGWMHEKQELGQEEISISADYHITRKPRRVLSSHIFCRTPMALY